MRAQGVGATLMASATSQTFIERSAHEQHDAPRVLSPNPRPPPHPQAAAEKNVRQRQSAEPSTDASGLSRS